MEDTVSVLTWECWLWEDTMDMTDWARLLLPGSSERGGEGGGRRSALGPVSGRRSRALSPAHEARTAAASPGPRPDGAQMEGSISF